MLAWIFGLALILIIAVQGWRLHQTSATLLQKDGEIQSLRAEVARAAKTRESARASLQAAESVRSSGAGAAVPGSDFTVRSPMETLEWLKARNQHLLMVPFHPINGAYGFDTQMAIMLGLKPDEYDRLNAAIRQTQQQLNDLAIQAATAHLSPDGKTLQVTVPSLAAGGDALYSSLLNTFAQVLGPDRFQVFNALAGDTFDTSFDRFGLNPTSYVLTLQPLAPAAGPPLYQVTRNYTDATGKSRGWSNSTYRLPDLQKDLPVLAHFLPPELAQQATTTTGTK